MKFVLMPTLRHRALVAVAVTLWDSHDMSICSETFLPLFNLAGVSDHHRQLRWSTVSIAVQERAEELDIPIPLKEELLRVVDAVGWEVFLWLCFHIRGCRIVEALPNKLFWTTHGTIDKQKTALALMCDERLDIINRFKLACLFCLEEHILTLWEHVKVDICEQLSQPSKFYCGRLVIYWRNYMFAKSEYPNYEYWLNPAVGMKEAMLDSNLVAVKFFLPKLTEQDRNKLNFDSLNKKLGSLKLKDYKHIYLANVRLSGDAASTVCLVLQSLNEELQLKILKSFPMQILNLFLEWPWQGSFIEWYQYLEQFLSEEQLCFLLERILCKRSNGHEDWDYHHLFIELWLKASISIRQGVFKDIKRASSVIAFLYELEDWNTHNLILEQATPKQREHLLLDKKLCMKTYEKFIAVKKWGTLECFVTECLKSERALCAFRVGMNCFCFPGNTEPPYREFNELIDKLMSDIRDRCSGSHNNNPKRLCI